MPPTDPLRHLGVRQTARGGELRVWSRNATGMELVIFDDKDASWVASVAPMTRVAGTPAGTVPGTAAATTGGGANGDVWHVTSPRLVAGTRYAIRASGPKGRTHDFDPTRNLIDPYARGLARTSTGEWRSYVQDDAFDWGDSERPNIGRDHTVIYEAHVKGLTKSNPSVPEELRGTYAALAHESTIAYLKDLGVTTVQLLPVHQSVTEQRLVKQGLANYWGYNTLNYFTPHAAYASRAAQFGGTGAVLREFKGMVKLLHEAGLEVILDVVYNHTSEEGPGGPTTSLRGLDNAAYYRQMADGDYIDVTGCGNTIDFSLPAAQRLVLDSLRYWFNDVRVDGFRFDLAATLGRDADTDFNPAHPLLAAIVNDPQLAGAKMIAEPWDVGMGGWQVGKFPAGFSEWNDGFRDRARDFWLTDIAAARHSGVANQGIGGFARRLAGSSHVFPEARGPLASVNFITAHDGFTMADLTAYNQKHNLGNGENNRDGADNNHSFNHGVEGPTRDESILEHRCKTLRNLLGTLILSAGIPMITAGDEFGRSQRGNNNAYCQDSELSWLGWEGREEWQDELLAVTRTLLRLRRENPALRPVRYSRFGETIPSASQMDWYNADGLSMREKDWHSPTARTLQYLAASTPEFEEFNRILLVVHGLEREVTITLPEHEGVGMYTLLWDSARDDLSSAAIEHQPGDDVRVAGASMQLYRANESVAA